MVPSGNQPWQLKILYQWRFFLRTIFKKWVEVWIGTYSKNGGFFIATFDYRKVSHTIPLGFFHRSRWLQREESWAAQPKPHHGILLAFGWVVGRCTRNCLAHLTETWRGVNPFELVKPLFKVSWLALIVVVGVHKTLLWKVSSLSIHSTQPGAKDESFCFPSLGPRGCP